MIVYLIVAAIIGFMVSYALFSIPSLPAKDRLFSTTNYLTAIM